VEVCRPQDTYGNYPPTAVHSITAATKSKETTLTVARRRRAIYRRPPYFWMRRTIPAGVPVAAILDIHNRLFTSVNHL
jgi:hypothetical protein